MKSDKLFIWPVDGITGGEQEIRTVPLEGFFAVKLGRHALERAMSVHCNDGVWSAQLDGYMLAPPNADWQKSFGWLWEAASKQIAPILMGRALNRYNYNRLIEIRSADKERGIDLSAAVDLNSVEIPTF